MSFKSKSYIEELQHPKNQTGIRVIPLCKTVGKDGGWQVNKTLLLENIQGAFIIAGAFIRIYRGSSL